MVLGEIGRMRTGEVALGDIKLFGLCRALSISLQMISTALISPGSPLFAVQRVTLLLHPKNPGIRKEEDRY